MAHHSFGALIDIESANKTIVGPPLALKKSVRAPEPIELEDYASKMRDDPIDHLASGAQTPNENNEFTVSHPPTPIRHTTAPLVETWSNPPGNKWRILTTCLAYFGLAMNDSAAGALIPYMETNFHIGYAVVSLIFVTNAIGFLTAAFVVDLVVSKLGRQRTLILSELIMSIGFVGIVAPSPFPVVVVAFLLIGFSTSMLLAVCNVFCVNLAKSSIILGLVHGSYGLGGIFGPIIATALVSRGVYWSRYYSITLGIRVLTLLCVSITWRGYGEDHSPNLLTALERTASRRAAADAGMSEPNKLQLLKMALKNRVTIIGALFIFAYQGAEVSISGWVISFLITYREGDPAKVGYVTAGFWVS